MGLFFALAIMPLQGVTHNPPLPSTLGGWMLVGASGIVQYALAFSLYMKALQTVSASLAGSFLNLTPVFGLAGAFVFLREELSIIQTIGALLTIATVTMISLGDASGRAQ